MRQLKAPECACQDACKGPALMAEALVLEEPRRHGGAVHGDAGAVRTVLVNGAGEELFAGAGLPLEEDGRVGEGDEGLLKTTFRVAPAFTIARFLNQVFVGVDDRGIIECNAVHGHHSLYDVPGRG